ncbi:MAG: QcrA and Rieske domain-containing protein [Candidatus Deferrimicrobiaceae bacterium]
MPSSRHDHRRSFLSLALGTVAAVFSASLLYPLFQFLWPPTAKTGGEGSVGIPLEDMLVGQSRVVPLRGEPVLLIREANQVVALSAVCTHLGCIVKYKGGGVILCPCHAASFDLNGNVTGGPAPRPLTYYRVRIVGGRIVIES